MKNDKKQKKLFISFVSFILLFSLSIFLSGCKKEICTTDKDCATGSACTDGNCVKVQDGNIVRDAGEKINLNDEHSTQTEPSPIPDITWHEGRFKKPDRFIKSKFSQMKPIRKERESCNPRLTALPEDRCVDGLICVAPNLGEVGICRKKCDPNKTGICASNELCGPIISHQTGKIIDHACGLAMNLGENCTFGWYCKKGLRCAPYGSHYRGVCAVDCTGNKKCKTGEWCSSVGGFPERDKDASVCYHLAKEGESCEGPNRCENGLVCLGKTKRICHKDCKNTQCPKNSICIGYKDHTGKVLYAGCHPIVEDGRLCGEHTRCQKGSVCTTFSAPKGASLCLKNCTKDSKLCLNRTQCKAASAVTKVCSFGNAIPPASTQKLGESCHPYRAAKVQKLCVLGLICTNIKKDWFCLQRCDPKQPHCLTGQSCQKLPQSDTFICAKLAKKGEQCNPSQSILCEGKSLCDMGSFSQIGICRTPIKSNVNEYCLEEFLDCQKGDICAGDPVTPFRWTCRKPCTIDQSIKCPNNEKCLKIKQEGACFPSCNTLNSSCPDHVHHCKIIQNKKVCL